MSNAPRLGHEPRIIPAIYVKPFVKGQKNDYNDTEAIAEAVLRPNLRLAQMLMPVRKCIARGLEPPVYGPRKPRERRIGRSPTASVPADEGVG